MKTRSQTYPSPNDIVEKKRKGKETVKDVKYIAKTKNRRKSNITPTEVSDVKQNTVQNTKNSKKNRKSIIQSTKNKVEKVNKRKIKKQITDEENDSYQSEKDITRKNQHSPKILRRLLEEDSYKIRGKQQKIDDCSKITDDSFCNSSNSTTLKSSLKRNDDDDNNTENIGCMKDESNNSNKTTRQNEQSKEVNDNLKQNCAVSVKDNEKSEKDTEDKTLINKSENVELMKLENETSLGNRKINIHGIIIEEINKFETDEEKSFMKDDNSSLDDKKSEKGNTLDADYVDNIKPEQVIDKAFSFPSSENMHIEELKKQCNTNEINNENSSENENNNQKDTNFMSFNDNQNNFINESDKEIDSDSDSSPEEVTFQNSQNKALSFLKDAEDEVRRIKLKTKESRRKYHERNFIQKEEKKKRILELKAKKLPQNVLDDISKLEKTKQLNEYSEGTFSKKIKFDEENEHSDVRVNQAQEELISIHGNTEFKVCKLNNFVKKPMTIAESAKEWKRNLLFGKRNKRESVKEMMAKKVKQSVSGKLLPIH